MLLVFFFSAKVKQLVNPPLHPPAAVQIHSRGVLASVAPKRHPLYLLFRAYKRAQHPQITPEVGQRSEITRGWPARGRG